MASVLPLEVIALLSVGKSTRGKGQIPVKGDSRRLELHRCCDQLEPYGGAVTAKSSRSFSRMRPQNPPRG